MHNWKPLGDQIVQVESVAETKPYRIHLRDEISLTRTQFSMDSQSSIIREEEEEGRFRCSVARVVYLGQVYE